MTFSQIVDDIKRALTAYKVKWDKIDDTPIDGIHVDGRYGGPTTSKYHTLGYLVDSLHHHVHNTEKVYGNNTWMTEDLPVAFSVTGGNNAWGTEVLIYKGDTIESGNTVKRFDLNTLYVPTVSAANKISVVEFLYGTAGTAITGVVTSNANDNFTKASHGLVNGDKIIFNTVTTTTGITAAIVYYVINVSGATFQVSLTSGGSAVVLGTGDGSCSISKMTQSTLTKCFISKTQTTANVDPYKLTSQKVTCNNMVSVRAKSESGSTIAIGFLLGLHTYDS